MGNDMTDPEKVSPITIRREPVVDSPGLRSIRRRSVVDEVIEQMTQRIVAGEWPPGYLLPGHRTLATDMGVSSVTVREAIRTLQGQGLLDSRHGYGTFVREVADAEVIPWMLDPREHHEYLELMEARSLIENELIRLARERATNDDMTRLLATVDEMSAARTDVQGFMDADLRFHIALAEAAHNGALLRTMLAIRGPLRRFMRSRAVRQLQDEGSLDIAVADHRAVADSIAGGSARAGAAAMNRIITRGRAHVLESVEEENAPASRTKRAKRQGGETA